MATPRGPFASGRNASVNNAGGSRIIVEVDAGRGALQSFLRAESEALYFAAQEAVAQQTEETKRAARLVVATGLRNRRPATSRAHVANTVRSEFWPDGPSFAPGAPRGFVHDSWGYRGPEGTFVSVLAVHERGATIVPRRAKSLFIPFVKLGRGFNRPAKLFDRLNERLDFIPLPSGRTLVVTRPPAKGQKGLALGLFSQREVIPPRLDFTAVIERAKTGLAEKLLIQLEVQGRRRLAA